MPGNPRQPGPPPMRRDWAHAPNPFRDLWFYYTGGCLLPAPKQQGNTAKTEQRGG